jgi:hypothetical protein
MAAKRQQEPSTERLEALEARIEELERRVAEHNGETGPKYYESGSIHPELDDQTITPPG